LTSHGDDDGSDDDDDDDDDDDVPVPALLGYTLFVVAMQKN